MDRPDEPLDLDQDGVLVPGPRMVIGARQLHELRARDPVCVVPSGSHRLEEVSAP